MFQHFIITRFNLRRADWKTTKNSEEVLTETWLKNRFTLFENYCLPSVKKQKNQNFKWLVFLDTNTPEIYKEKISSYNFDNLLPFFIDGMDNFLPSIKEKIQELNTTDYIITSRLDNDDSLHMNYVDLVQSMFDRQKFMAVDIVDGYGMQTGDKVKLGKMRHLYNPYISLIESVTNDFETVWFRGHTYWKFENKITRVKDKPSWLTIIHQENKSNRFRGFGKVRQESLDDFNIKKEKLAELKARFFDSNQWILQNIKNRWYCFAAYYGKEVKKKIGLYKLKVLFAKNEFD